MRGARLQEAGTAAAPPRALRDPQKAPHELQFALVDAKSVAGKVPGSGSDKDRTPPGSGGQRGAHEQQVSCWQERRTSMRAPLARDRTGSHSRGGCGRGDDARGRRRARPDAAREGDSDGVSPPAPGAGGAARTRAASLPASPAPPPPPPPPPPLRTTTPAAMSAAPAHHRAGSVSPKHAHPTRAVAAKLAPVVRTVARKEPDSLMPFKFAARAKELVVVTQRKREARTRAATAEEHGTDGDGDGGRRAHTPVARETAAESEAEVSCGGGAGGGEGGGG